MRLREPAIDGDAEPDFEGEETEDLFGEEEVGVLEHFVAEGGDGGGLEEAAAADGFGGEAVGDQVAEGRVGEEAFHGGVEGHLFSVGGGGRQEAGGVAADVHVRHP